MAVADELAGLTARGREAQTHEHVVQPALEQREQVLAGDARLPGGLFVVAVELPLEHSVVAARLLLLAQLHPVLALFHAPTPMLARRVGAALDAALVRQAALALEEQLLSLAAALLALWACVSCHSLVLCFALVVDGSRYTRRRLRGRQPLWACGVTSLTPVTSRPAACSERIAVSRPEPGPLT